MTVGSPDSGKKPKAPDNRSDGNGGSVAGRHVAIPPKKLSLEKARGGQSSPHPVFRAKEKRNVPVVPDRHSDGGHRVGKNAAKDPTIVR